MSTTVENNVLLTPEFAEEWLAHQTYPIVADPAKVDVYAAEFSERFGSPSRHQRKRRSRHRETCGQHCPDGVAVTRLIFAASKTICLLHLNRSVPIAASRA
jgi:hypothetical protein